MYLFRKSQEKELGLVKVTQKGEISSKQTES